MRILFCDDNPQILTQLQKYVAEFFKNLGVQCPEFAVYEACSHLLAAGAEPTGVTVQLLLPEEYSEPELKTLTATLDQAAGHYGAVILGGHTEVVPGLVKLVITVTAVGKAKSLPLKAEPELDLVVAGTIAGSAAARLAADQREQLLECFSAIGTVGLSTGITPQLGAPARILLILLMYTGRVGSLTLFTAMSLSQNGTRPRCPVERVMIG